MEEQRNCGCKPECNCDGNACKTSSCQCKSEKKCNCDSPNCNCSSKKKCNCEPSNCNCS